MESRPVSTVGRITGGLMVFFLIYGIVFGKLNDIIYSAITLIIPNKPLILIIVNIILQGISVFLLWQCCIKSVFKKIFIKTDDVKILMRNLIVILGILSFMIAIFNFAKINKLFSEKISSNPTLRIAEKYKDFLYEDATASYEEMKDKMISEAKTKLYIYFAVLEMGSLIVCLGATLLQKKTILKYAV